MSARLLVTAWLVVSGATSTAFAQRATGPSLQNHELVVSAGPIWSGGYGIGDSVAELRSNAAGSQPPPFTLFAVSSSMEQLAGINASVEYAITPSLSIEGGGWYARANIAAALSRDAEASPTLIDGEKMHQVILSGGLAWQLPRSLGRRVAPFVAAGAGYLRQLHEERTLVETGQVYYVGFGARYFILGGASASRSMGLRGDFRLAWRTPGVDFEDKTRKFPTVTLLLFVGL